MLKLFVKRGSNGFGECFNGKIKGFRGGLRGVRDIKLFVLRVRKVYG